jgi:hypothetical protein
MHNLSVGVLGYGKDTYEHAFFVEKRNTFMRSP